MDNLRRLASAEEVNQFIADQWRTRDFKDSHLNGPYIKDVVGRVAEFPILVADVHGSAERSQFLPMLGVLPLRPDEYQDRPFIADLYLMHELVHMGRLQHDESASVESWEKGICYNELQASLHSEVIVYFEMPSLRKQTFPFEIWADRFLENRVKLHADYLDNFDLFEQDKDLFWNSLVEKRNIATFNPIVGDQSEQLVSKYQSANREWLNIWRDKRLEVTGMMTKFRAMSLVDRGDALDQLEAWLKEVQGADSCPFYEKAAKFAEVISRIYA